MATNREEAIKEAKAERARKLALIERELPPDQAASFREVLAFSEQGRAKLQEAVQKSDPYIYNDWKHDVTERFYEEFSPISALFHQHSVILLDHIGMDLSNAQLPFRPNPAEWACGLDSRNADWTGANFENANLAGFLVNPPNRFHWCNFRNADLSHPCMGVDGATTLKEKVWGAVKMEGGHYDHSDFTGANLTGQMLNCVSCRHCNFTRANMSYAEDIIGDFEGAVFDQTNLTGIKMEVSWMQKLPLAFQQRWQECNPATARTTQGSGQSRFI